MITGLRLTLEKLPLLSPADQTEGAIKTMRFDDDFLYTIWGTETPSLQPKNQSLLNGHGSCDALRESETR
jgi:hypothetical protein